MNVKFKENISFLKQCPFLTHNFLVFGGWLRGILTYLVSTSICAIVLSW